jgi:hypothetical protein
MYDPMRRPEAGAASHALGAKGVCPRQVEVHDDPRVLQVDAFGDEVCSQQQADALVGRRRGASVGEWGEVCEHVGAGERPTGDVSAAAGDDADTGDVGERALEGGNGPRELGERHDGRVGVLVQQGAQGVGAHVVGLCVPGMMPSEIAECVEVALQDLQQRPAFNGLLGEQFREGELAIVVAHDPASQFLLGGVSSGAQGVVQRGAAELAPAHGVGECGIARAPGAQQAEPDEGTSDGAVVGGKWGR